MSGFGNSVTSVRRLVLASMLVSCSPLISFADDVISDELRRCGSIDEAQDRLACYDGLSGRHAPEIPKPPQVQETTTVSPEPPQVQETTTVPPEPPQAQETSAASPEPPQAQDISTASREPSQAEQTSATPSQQALDNIGSEQLSRSADEDFADQAQVVRCKKDPYKKYYFYLENGQVWKQSNNKRVYFRDCNFNVTITKDVFGYKMQKEGEVARIRISRVK